MEEIFFSRKAKFLFYYVVLDLKEKVIGYDFNS